MSQHNFTSGSENDGLCGRNAAPRMRHNVDSARKLWISKVTRTFHVVRWKTRAGFRHTSALSRFARGWKG